MLRRRSQSAGNPEYRGSSETICGGIVAGVNPVSARAPKPRKPNSDIAFGEYLAGLIDGDGHFNVQQQLVIAFHISDAPLAYFVKRRVGFGSVRRVKGKNAVILVISSQAGMERVLHLI